MFPNVDRMWRKAWLDGRARRRERRILFGLDYEPAPIARGPDETGHRGEVQVAVARHREHAAAHARIEAQVAGSDAAHHGQAQVLQVNMHDPVAETVDEVGIVEPGGRRVAGVEQQARFRPGLVEDRGDLIKGLGHHHQVVVIGERKAILAREPLAELGEARGVGLYRIGRHQPALRHGYIERRALRHHRHLAVDHHLAP